MDKVTNLAGRVLLALLFVPAGLNKIGAYEGTQAYMEAMGVPGALLPLVILVEVVAGLALIIGWHTRLMAIALAGFSVVSGVIFHADFGDQTQMVMFMKNLAIAGGLLVVASQDVRDSISLDRRRLAAATAS